MTFIDRKHQLTIYAAALFGILLWMIIFASMLGVAEINFRDATEILISKIPLLKNLVDGETLNPTHVTIVWNIRLPRILLASFVGMGLSISGATFQGMFKNPMAEPYVLGISSGAALGATIAIVLGLQNRFFGFGGVSMLAFFGAIMTITVVYTIARVGGKVPVITLLLAGISINYLLSSVISLMMIFHRTQIERVVFWLMGSVASAGWNHVYLLGPVLLFCSIAIFFYAKDLNLMLLGEESAQSLGVDIEITKKILLVINSILVAVTVSVSGIIGFVGLIIPHTIKLLIGSDYRSLLPFSMLGGGIFMIFCDTLARTAVPPTEIPVGAITSLFGAPYFIYLLIKRKKKVV